MSFPRIFRGDISSWARGSHGYNPIRQLHSNKRSGCRDIKVEKKSFCGILSRDVTPMPELPEPKQEVVVLPAKEAKLREPDEFGNTLEIQRDFWTRLGFPDCRVTSKT